MFLKKSIRIISLLLALAMLLGVLVGCTSDDADIPEDESDTVSTSGVDDSSEDGVYPYTPYKTDFGGYEFRVLSRGGPSGWVDMDIMGDFTGDVLGRAVAERNANVTEKYNFTIKESKKQNFNEIATNDALAGQDTYDMWFFMMREMTMHGISGYIRDLRTLEHMHIDESYYNQNVRKTATYADYLFFITGDLLYIDEQSTAAMFFKYDQFYQEEFDKVYGKDLYQLVEDGEWTFEKLKTFAELATYEKGGDDSSIGYDDSLGFVYENATMLALNIGFGNLAMSKDVNDLFVPNTSKTQIDAFQDIQDFLTGPYCLPTDGRNLAFIQYGWLQMLRGHVYGEGIDFGVIPYPKATEDQKSYYSLVTTWGSASIAVPTAVADAEKAASIIDIISFESQKLVVPAYNEWIFEYKGAQRPQDVKMLEYILAGQIIEPAHLWLDTGLYYALKNLLVVNKGSGGTVEKAGVASTIESAASKVAAKNEEYLEFLKKLY